MSKKKDRRLLYTSEQRANSPIWLTIYADLMTNLMLFFLMLWGLTRVSLESFSEAADSLRNKITKEGRNIEASVKISDDDDDKSAGYIGYEAIEKMKSDVQGIKLVLDSPILFDLGSSQIKGGAKEQLDDIIAYLYDVNYRAVIEGHTDNTPIGKNIGFTSNWELSLDRARNVVKYFEDQGIDPKRLVIAGYGEHHPIFPNDTEEHKSQNRRIEVNIIFKENI